MVALGDSCRSSCGVGVGVVVDGCLMVVFLSDTRADLVDGSDERGSPSRLSALTSVGRMRLLSRERE